MQRSLTTTWLVIGLIALCGCQSVPLFSRAKYLESDARHPVMEVLCVWEAAEGRGTDNLPCRGFGGQILCFASGYKEPVKVQGDVRVYVFDDHGVSGDSSLPIHQFDFTAEAWNTFLKPSSLGASYQLFVPYTRKGLDSASCTLRVRLSPEGGTPIYSRLATVALTGHASDKRKLASEERVVTISHETQVGEKQEIVTADWSEMVHDPETAAAGMSPSQPPGISLATHQAEARQARNMSTLRQAAEEASREAPSEPPRPFSPALTGLKLMPLRPSQLENRAADSADHEPSDADSEREMPNSSVTPPAKRRHPLADF